MRTYKCLVCGKVFDVEDGVEPVCPVCKAKGDKLIDIQKRKWQSCCHRLWIFIISDVHKTGLSLFHVSILWGVFYRYLFTHVNTCSHESTPVHDTPHFVDKWVHFLRETAIKTIFG